ncbi:cysteine-rich receptor-like protein kinase 8 [Tanacetum coccineum]|uniref:Cysteine-rich receptor-like protein kinase 8 n=1 Tax=Tanacetum coccineum TaxID=301880 RepID=A0ABQ5H363_9ASTR
MGLDECFANVRGQILLMQPLPNVTKAYVMMRQEEKQRETNIPKFSSPAVMSTFNNSRYPNNQTAVPNTRQFKPNSTLNTKRINFKPGVICGNCQKEGHYQSECYHIVGYLVGYPLHGSRQDGVSINECKISGTQAGDAVFSKTDSLQMQLNQVMMMLQNPQGQCDPKLLAAGRYMFTASCVSLFKDAWVVDSGATDHICITLSLMFNIIHLTIPIIISLPNGHTLTVTTIGSGNNQKIAHGVQSDRLYIIQSGQD